MLSGRSRVRATRKLAWSSVSALLVVAGLMVAAPSAAFANGSSCYNGSCEAVNGSGLKVNTTNTYASSPHCNQTLGTTQFDQKGFITQYTINPFFVSGCSTEPMFLNWGNLVLPANDNFYGQSYFNNNWQGIATVYVHS